MKAQRVVVPKPKKPGLTGFMRIQFKILGFCSTTWEGNYSKPDRIVSALDIADRRPTGRRGI